MRTEKFCVKDLISLYNRIAKKSSNPNPKEKCNFQVYEGTMMIHSAFRRESFALLSEGNIFKLFLVVETAQTSVRVFLTEMCWYKQKQSELKLHFGRFRTCMRKEETHKSTQSVFIFSWCWVAWMISRKNFAVRWLQSWSVRNVYKLTNTLRISGLWLKCLYMVLLFFPMDKCFGSWRKSMKGIHPEANNIFIDVPKHEQLCLLMWTHFEECTMIFSLVIELWGEICQLLCFLRWNREHYFMCKIFPSIFPSRFNIISFSLKKNLVGKWKVKTFWSVCISVKVEASDFHSRYCDDKHEHNCTSLHINIAFVLNNFFIETSKVSFFSPFWATIPAAQKRNFHFTLKIQKTFQQQIFHPSFNL